LRAAGENFSINTKQRFNPQERTSIMELEAAKMIGAGIAALALGGAGIGLGNLFGSYMEGAFRNPEAQSKLKVNPMLAFALIEATGLFGFVIAMIILFG
jgi:F-type H+-transporting ATPase subunit c